MIIRKVLISLIFPLYCLSQTSINGTVLDKDNQPIVGASVYIENTQIGTITSKDGKFKIESITNAQYLIISYIGFKTEKIKLPITSPLIVVLKEDNELDEALIIKSKKSTEHSLYKAINTQVMGQKELLKAACCNLSESFSTNPSIDVNFTDAISGNKQIKMLGLTSPYILIVEENIPAVRGASQAYGLSFIPGTWVESIQITKGAGSVVNGYESISGQINYEVLKPLCDVPFFLNAYASNDSRYELNTHINKKLSDKISTTLFVHGNTRLKKFDMNDDGFLDNPLAKQINVLNRWQYSNTEKGWVSFLNLRFLKDEKQSGQIKYKPNRDKFAGNYWGSEVNTQKIDVSSKLGYVFPDAPYQSFGLQQSYQYHKQNSYFGNTQYNIHQKSYYANFLFNSIINNTKNKFSSGINFNYDNFIEDISINFSENFSRIDNGLGAFFEYTYDNLDNLSIVAGIRSDFHNRLGSFITPRIHIRYNPWESAVIRASAGRGKRAANIFAENQQLFASSRNFNIIQDNGKLYGLNPEIAYNYGLSFIQKFKLLQKDAEIILDYYVTDFKNQAVVDVDTHTQNVYFYDLDGKSFANSFQAEFGIEPLKHLNLRTSYKFYNVKTDYISGFLQKPLQAQHRFFANVAYETHIKEKGKQWKFDFTYNWLGKQRLPNTQLNPVNYRLEAYSPAFTILNAQITRTFSSVFEMYIGGENIGNYKQKNGIIDNQNPFGTFFDASMIYAPVFGSMYYAGLRFKIK